MPVRLSCSKAPWQSVRRLSSSFLGCRALMRLQRQQGMQLQAAEAEIHRLQISSNSLLAEKDAEIAALQEQHRRQAEVRLTSRPKPCRSCLWL